MVPKTRLGKRSPLGTLVSGSSVEGLTETGSHSHGDGVIHKIKLYPGQKVRIDECIRFAHCKACIVNLNCILRIVKKKTVAQILYFMVCLVKCFRCMCTAVAGNVAVWWSNITMWTMRCQSSCLSSTSTYIASWKTYGRAQRPVLTPQSPHALMCQKGTASRISTFYVGSY